MVSGSMKTVAVAVVVTAATAVVIVSVETRILSGCISNHFRLSETKTMAKCRKRPKQRPARYCNKPRTTPSEGRNSHSGLTMMPLPWVIGDFVYLSKQMCHKSVRKVRKVWLYVFRVPSRLNSFLESQSESAIKCCGNVPSGYRNLKCNSPTRVGPVFSFSFSLPKLRHNL